MEARAATAALAPGARLGPAGRYQIVRVLGAGGLGVVHEAIDHASGERVALKTLTGGDPQVIKREFRVAAGVVHPNLVQLYDLFDGGGGVICLTMELVPGVDLLTDLAPAGAGPTPAPTATIATRVVAGEATTTPSPPLSTVAIDLRDTATAGPQTGPVRAPAALRALDPARIRDRFAQLARGLLALHRRGLVHRDVKPFNVRVTPEGRVVILDFGLAAPLGAAPVGAGTVAYMAPEQSLGDEVTAAADWYAVGAVLFEVLTGGVPWDGSAPQVLARKRMSDPPAVASRAPTAPADLAGLADALLARDPAARPDAAAILDRLGQRRRARDHGPIGPAVFVGRAAELGKLRDAWDQVTTGGAAWIAIEGGSGIGKSALVAAFAREVGARGGRVFAGRCYERETLPFKGLDPVIDALAAGTRAGDLPASAVARLARAFPVLRAHVDDTTSVEDIDIVDRAQLATALRALIAASARAAPTVIVIDDAQWADRDSLDLIAAAFAPPLSRIMLLVAARPVERGAAADPIASRRADRAFGWSDLPLPFAPIVLDALGADDAVELAQVLLGRAAVTIDARAIAAAVDGHPLDIADLVGETLRAGAPAIVATPDRATGTEETPVPPFEPGRAAAPSPGRARPSGDRLLRRLAQLDADAHALAALIVTAGSPVPLAALAAAAGRSPDDTRAIVDRLQRAALAVSRRLHDATVIEPAHDRVREVLFSHLSEHARRASALALAVALEAHGHDPGQVAELYHRAGDLAAAARCARSAAERAIALGAYDAAAALWAQVRDLVDAGAPADPTTDADPIARQAEALAFAGRGREAAAEFLAAAGRTTDAALRARRFRAAAEQLLRAGLVDDGLRLLRDHVERWAELPRSEPIAYARGLALHAETVVALRLGRGPRTRASATASAEFFETLWAGIAGHTLSTPGAFLLTTELLVREALAVGDPHLVSLGWAAEATLACFLGERGHVDRCLRRCAVALSTAGLRAGREHGVVTATMALARLGDGAWADAEALCEDALAGFEQTPGAYWERATGQTIILTAQAMRGRIAALVRRVRRQRARTRARGDLYATELLHTGYAVVADLAGDDVDGAIAALAELDRRPTGIMTAWLRGTAHGHVAAYAGHADSLARAAALVDPLLAQPLLRNPMIVTTLLTARIAAALRAAADGAAPDRRLPRWLRRLARQAINGAAPVALLYHAGFDRLRGDRAAARDRAAAAELGLLAADMPVHALAARAILAPSSALVDRLAADGVVRPEAFARLYLPVPP